MDVVVGVPPPKRCFTMPRIYISKEKWNEIVRKIEEDPDEWVKRLIDEELKREFTQVGDDES